MHTLSCHSRFGVKCYMCHGDQSVATTPTAFNGGQNIRCHGLLLPSVDIKRSNFIGTNVHYWYFIGTYIGTVKKYFKCVSLNCWKLSLYSLLKCTFTSP